MSKLSKNDVKKIADLARLEVSDKDLEFYTQELSGVLEYVDQLNELDTQNIEPTSNIGGLLGVVRPDEEYDENVKDRTGLAKTLMNLVPITQKGFAKVKNVFNR